MYACIIKKVWTPTSKTSGWDFVRWDFVLAPQQYVHGGQHDLYVDMAQCKLFNVQSETVLTIVTL